jgi:WD40 repeat protein
MKSQIIALMLTMLITFTNGLWAHEDNQEYVSSVAWSPDGSKIASASDTGNVQLWDTVTSEVLLEFQGHVGTITTISWSPNSTRLATASPEDKVERIWDATTGALITELSGDRFYEGVAFVRWNPNGTNLVSVVGVADGGSLLHFWSVENNSFQALPTTYNVSAYDLAWSPDGTKLAIADYRGVFVFDDFSMANIEPRVIAPFRFTVAWGPDGTKLAVSDVRSGVVDILDADGGQVLTTIQGPARTSENGIASLTWTSDGITLILDEYSGTVQSWNAVTGELLETLSLNRQGGRFLMSLSPYGGRLALGNSASVSDTASIQVDKGVIQTFGDGAVQIVVPAPSRERLQAIAEACNAPTAVEQALAADIQADNLTAFVAQVESLPENTIPAACAADLIAVAEALQNQ